MGFKHLVRSHYQEIYEGISLVAADALVLGWLTGALRGIKQED
jgi:hypothetical protein